MSEESLGAKNSLPLDSSEQVLDTILKTENFVANKKGPAQDLDEDEIEEENNESPPVDEPQDDPNFEEFIPSDESEGPPPETVDWVRKPSKETPEASKYDKLIQEEIRERKIMNQQGFEVD